MESSLIPEWMAEAEHAILHPEDFKYVGYEDSEAWRAGHTTRDRVIPPILQEKYDLFHTRGMAHVRTKQEHEVAAAINFYVIYKYKLWRAECDSWSAYTDYIGEIQGGPSKSKVEHDVLEIDKLLLQGMQVSKLIAAMSVAKGATARLADIPKEKLPDGDINKAAEQLALNSPAEAHRTVDDWEGVTQFHSISAVYDSKNARLYFGIRIIKPDGDRIEQDFMIKSIELEVSEWIMKMLKVPQAKREFK